MRSPFHQTLHKIAKTNSSNMYQAGNIYFNWSTKLISFIILLGGISFFSVHNVQAQNHREAFDCKRLNQYTVDSWDILDGLPTNSLQQIHQSYDGYLWISSYSGIIRFDGERFTMFNKANTEAITNNSVFDIIETPDSTLWFSAQGVGLLTYKNGVFSRFSDSLSLDIMDTPLFLDHDNRVMFFSSENGWIIINPDRSTNTIKYDKFDLAKAEVRSVVQDKNDVIWIGTNRNGIFRYENGQITRIQKGIEGNTIFSICELSNGLFLLGTENGLLSFNGKKVSPILPQIKTSVNEIIKDKQGHICIGTIEGLYRWDMKSGDLEKLTSKDGLPSNFVGSLYFDVEGSLWITHYKGGLSRLKDNGIINYNSENGMPSKVVNSITEKKNGNCLIAFDDGIVLEYDGKTFTEINYDKDQKSQRIRHTFFDSHGTTWISTYSGLYQITPKGKIIKNLGDPNFPETRIRFVYEDSKGRFWIGSRDLGIIRLEKDNSYTFFTEDDGLPGDMILDIKEDKNGNFYVCLSGGKYCLSIIDSNDHITNIGDENGFFSDVAFNSYIDNDNCVWIASDKGLYRYKDAQFKYINTQDKLPDDSMYDVLEDNLGYLWIPYNEGILKINKAELNNFFDGKKENFNYSIIDEKKGMRVREGNATSKALLSSSGLLYFPTLDGFIIANPEHSKKNLHIPNVIIENMIADQQTIPHSDTIVLPPSTKRIQFNYTATSLLEPKMIEFKYKLEGFDKDWTSIKDVRCISYTNLPHKTMTFKVQASNNDGIWNETGDSITFTIKQRFNETWIFRVSMFLIVTFILIGLYYLRIHNLQQRKKELEDMVDKRTILLKEKNENLERYSIEIQEKEKKLETLLVEIRKQSEELSRQKEELKTLNSFKDQIFKVIGHDLRAPLIRIINLLDMIVNQWFDNFPREKLLGWMMQLNALSHSSFALFDNLLNWALTQQDKKLFDPQNLNLEEVVEDVYRFVSPISKEKKISIHKEIPEGTSVYADENMLKAIIRNYLISDIERSREKEELSISAQIIDDEVEISVASKNFHLPPDVIEKLQSSNVDQSDQKTLVESVNSLDSFMAREFIEKHGSKLQIYSKKGEGCRFYFRLKREGKTAE